MYGQLDLEVIFKTFKEIDKTSNFHEFWSEEFHYKKWFKKLKIGVWMLLSHGSHWMKSRNLRILQAIIFSFLFYFIFKKWFL
jgi:hypothetical protein